MAKQKRRWEFLHGEEYIPGKTDIYHNVFIAGEVLQDFHNHVTKKLRESGVSITEILYEVNYNLWRWNDEPQEVKISE